MTPKMTRLFFLVLCLFLTVSLCLTICSHLLANENSANKTGLKDTLTPDAENPVSVQLNVLFVSIENYELAPLQYVSNDIEKFSALLQTHYGCKSRAVVDYPRSMKRNDKPEFYRDAVQKEIKNWGNSLSRSEIGILYLAGHGITDSKGKLCVPMVNFNGANYDDATIPLDWIRSVLNHTDAKCKLILLDTCFSGNSKGNLDTRICKPAQMVKAFDGLSKTATLASSTDQQKSWIWARMKHSLFTFWLIEAFRGNADLDNDCMITIDELYRYVEENVSWISQKSQEMQEQTPTLLNGDLVKQAFIIPIPQVGITEQIANIASQIDLTMSLSEFHNIVIPEFVTSEQDDSINPEYGTLPKYIASLLIRALNQNNRKPYTVYNENVIRDCLKQHHIRPADLGTLKTSDLKLGGKKVEVIARGRLNMFHANAMTISVELINTTTQETVACFTGSTLLTSAEMGMAGASFVVEGHRPQIQKDRSRIKYRKIQELNMYVPQERIEDLRNVNQQKEQKHPLANSEKNFWNVQIKVRPKGSNGPFVERKGAVIDNDYYVPLDKEEEYAIYLTNKGESDLWAKVLVDGRNTLSQPMTRVAKDLEVVEAANGKNVIAPRVTLDEAAAWMIYGTGRDEDGNKRTNSGQKSLPHQYAIFGFYDTDSRQNSKLYPFVLTDADEALENRDQYADQTGLITVAFCQAVPLQEVRGVHQDLGTRYGTGRDVELKTDQSETRPGDIVAVCNIRYISRDLFRKLTQ
ncbi:MAG: caspase family protein [Thermoguttaceae bacterium]|nr:caspase family protein [Thermoguttaceae bacterium]